MASKMTLEDEHESDAKMQRTGAAAAVLLCTFWPTPSHASLRVSTRALRKRVLGAEHRTTLVTGSYRYLTLYLFSQGKYAEAEALGAQGTGRAEAGAGDRTFSAKASTHFVVQPDGRGERRGGGGRGVRGTGETRKGEGAV